jgi:hypothetical protein
LGGNQDISIFGQVGESSGYQKARLRLSFAPDSPFHRSTLSNTLRSIGLREQACKAGTLIIIIRFSFSSIAFIDHFFLHLNPGFGTVLMRFPDGSNLSAASFRKFMAERQIRGSCRIDSIL